MAATTHRSGEPARPVAIDVFPTPIGRLGLAATARGLTHLAHGRECDTLAEEGEPGDDERAVLAAARRAVEEYLAGTGTALDVPVDPDAGPGFRGTVQRAMAEIPYGQTATYSQLAERVGNPQAYRAVGSACATNPIPLVWPCHRVVRTGGGLGGFRWGLEVKEWLLALERGERDSLQPLAGE